MSVASLVQRSGGVIGTIGPIGGKGMWSLRERGALAQDFYDNVSLYLKMNGANGSTTFYDSSKNGHVVTANGNAQISTTQSKFGGASAAFDGTGDYLFIPTNADFGFGTGDFTIEFWVYLVGTFGTILGTFQPSTASAWWINVGTTVITFANRNSNANAVYTGGSVSQNIWTHVALCRSGTTTRIFANGNSVHSFTMSNQNVSAGAGLDVGRVNINSFEGYLNGYIDDLRITKGVARYTGSFIPPARQFRP